MTRIVDIRNRTVDFQVLSPERSLKYSTVRRNAYGEIASRGERPSSFLCHARRDVMTSASTIPYFDDARARGTRASLLLKLDAGLKRYFIDRVCRPASRFAICVAGLHLQLGILVRLIAITEASYV
jgi:hypothetical protein